MDLSETTGRQSNNPRTIIIIIIIIIIITSTTDMKENLNDHKVDGSSSVRLAVLVREYQKSESFCDPRFGTVAFPIRILPRENYAQVGKCDSISGFAQAEFEHDRKDSKLSLF